MYVGVIRGDLPGPLFLADVEPSSQINFPIDPVGQTQYIEYPQPALITSYLSGLLPDGLSNGLGGVPAGIQATAVPSTLIIGSGNHVLRVKTASAGSFTAVNVAQATYTTLALLVVAVNAALKTASVAASATVDSTGTKFVLQSTAVGVGAFIAIDSVSNGSTFNTPASLTDSATFTMPSAASIISSMLPVGGPLNVSAANILTTLGGSPKAAGVVGLIAKKLIESETTVLSYQVGMISKYLEANFCPDPTRKPGVAHGAAIAVVEDDGTTAFSSSASAPLPKITGAVHSSPNAGDLTISGSGLGNSEFYEATKVTVTNAAGTVSVHLTQKQIVHTITGGTTGSVSATSIVIPASLLNGLGVVGSIVKVKYASLPSSNYGTAASITSFVGGIATMTGVTSMTAGSVGSFIKITGAANLTNNGTFRVMSFISSSSVTVGIEKGVANDANNGSIVWVNSPVSFTVT